MVVKNHVVMMKKNIHKKKKTDDDHKVLYQCVFITIEIVINTEMQLSILKIQ